MRRGACLHVCLYLHLNLLLHQRGRRHHHLYMPLGSLPEPRVMAKARRAWCRHLHLRCLWTKEGLVLSATLTKRWTGVFNNQQILPWPWRTTTPIGPKTSKHLPKHLPKHLLSNLHEYLARIALAKRSRSEQSGS